MIREYVAHLHDTGLEKSSIARKLAALRSFFKYCVREGLAERKSGAAGGNPEAAEGACRRCFSAEEMNGFFRPACGKRESCGTRRRGGRGNERRAGLHWSNGLEFRPAFRKMGCCLPARIAQFWNYCMRRGLRVSELTGLKPSGHGPEGQDVEGAREGEQGSASCRMEKRPRRRCERIGRCGIRCWRRAKNRRARSQLQT